MKKNLFFPVVLIALSSLALFSCKDDDGIDNPENKGEDDETPLVITTAKEANALVNSAYSRLQSLSSLYTFFAESATEIAVETDDETSGGAKLSRFETDPETSIAIKLFAYPYHSIGYANLAIEQINAAPLSDNLTQANKDLYVARAKFVRGYDYFKLVQAYGEVPLILSSESTITERSPIDDVYAQVVKDLTEAYSGLPVYDNTKSNPTQGAINTILAKAYLTWGQKPLSLGDVQAITGSRNDPAKQAVDREKLEQAVEYADKVISSGKYKLLNDYNTIWGVTNEGNDEVIFSIRHDGDGVDIIGNHQTHCGYTWPKEARKEPHISYADITLENRIPSNKDSRKLFSYVTGIEYTDGVKDTLTWPVSVVRSGKWIHRVADGTYRATDNQPNNIDHIDYRYAEVLLIKAEALFFLGKTSEALALINEVRQRAFGKYFENDGELTALTEDALYKEWDYEFAFEQKRWYNLVRWKTYLATVGEAVLGFEYYQEKYASAASINEAFPDVANINAAFYARLHKYQRAKYKNLDGKFYRLPIPVGLENEDLGITPQNPGY